MNRLVEIRRQEYFCRERALHDSERKLFWLAEAEEWEQRALDEIAFHFRECNLEAPIISRKRIKARVSARVIKPRASSMSRIILSGEM